MFSKFHGTPAYFNATTEEKASGQLQLGTQTSRRALPKGIQKSVVERSGWGLPGTAAQLKGRTRDGTYLRGNVISSPVPVSLDHRHTGE